MENLEKFTEIIIATVLLALAIIWILFLKGGIEAIIAAITFVGALIIAVIRYLRAEAQDDDGTGKPITTRETKVKAKQVGSVGDGSTGVAIETATGPIYVNTTLPATVAPTPTVEKPDIPYNVPALTANHVARELELTWLRDQLITAGDDVTVTALQGMGGVGKTTLAIAFCREAETVQAFPGGVLWATLGPPERDDDDKLDPASLDARAAEHLATWGTLLGVDVRGLGSAEERAAVLRGRLREARCLIALDDVWHADQITHLRLGGEQCRTLITTRLANVAARVSKRLSLDLMTEDEALALLAKFDDEGRAGTPEEALTLAQRLGLLPLALSLAGAQTRMGRTWAEMISEMEREQVDLSTLHDEDDATTRTRNLNRAFALSVDRLPAPLPRRFAMLGVFAAGRESAFDPRAVAHVWEVDEDTARADLRRLANAAVLDRLDVEIDPTGEYYTLHLLLADYGRARLSDEDREAAEASYVDAIYEVAQNSTDEWRRADALLGQLRAAWERVPRADGEALVRWTARTQQFFVLRG